MKRLLLTLILMLATTLTTVAQQRLYIDQAFTLYGMRKGCKKVEMHDATLRGYKLHVYKSLTYKKLGYEIDALLRSDARNAKKIREVIDNGRVASGYYQMSATSEGMNRFILYSRQSATAGTVIYIEGRLSADDIMKICYSKF